jgi:glycosyltransferase involved in cell wall biosynthesis
MAKALAKLGHDVMMVVNCPQERWVDGVEYLPLSKVTSIQSDVLILNTSGGDLDLSPALELDIETRLRIVWAHGVPKPGGLEQVQPDYAYAVSNFIAGIVKLDWGIPGEKVFVTYNAFDEDLFKESESHETRRDSFKLVYFSHPSKGLETALRITRLLRDINPNFHLDVLGGEELWGEIQSVRDKESGVTYRGLEGQLDVVGTLLKSTYSVQLQTRQEPGPLAAIEAMRAGCIVLASKVGAYLEYVEDGLDGFLFEGDPDSEVVLNSVVKKVLQLHSLPNERQKLQLNATTSHRSSLSQAKEWVVNWSSVL